MAPPIRPLEQRFWSKVEKTSSCWFWKGSKEYNGYGFIRVIGYSRPLPAHRVSYEIHYGPIPKGMIVCHRCDNPSCVRPDHLFLGTYKDNTQDAMKKKRHVPWKHNKKLTPTQVRSIRLDTRKKEVIAKEYNVHPYMIYAIKTRRAWKNIL